MEQSIQLKTEKIASYIYLIRGEKVIMDFTFAQLYEVKVRILKKAVSGHDEKSQLIFSAIKQLMEEK